jgi:3-hydroxyacyl-CoA dehydrogenase
MKRGAILRGRETDAQTIANAYDDVRALGKLPPVVNDAPAASTPASPSAPT